MSESVATAGHASAGKPAMSVFERFLTFWVALCIIVGIALGQLLPGVFHTLGEATVAQVNIPVAVLVWLMIVPMLLKIDLTALGQVGQHWRGIASTVGVNWLVKPFTMAVLGLDLHRASLPAVAAGGSDRELHGRSHPARRRPLHGHGVRVVEPRRWRAAFHAVSQVALNDTIMVVAFAPIVGLLLGLSSITVPWDTLILSVVLYIVVPVIVAQLWRTALLRQGGPAALSRMLSRLAPLSLCALLLTLVLLFGLQGEQIMHQPLVILLLAVPIIIQVYFNAGLAYWLNRKLGVEWCVAGPSALIGASQFLRARRGDGDRPFRLSVGCGARDRGRCAYRSAGDAFGRAHRAPLPRLV